MAQNNAGEEDEEEESCTTNEICEDGCKNNWTIVNKKYNLCQHCNYVRKHGKTAQEVQRDKQSKVVHKPYVFKQKAQKSAGKHSPKRHKVNPITDKQKEIYARDKEVYIELWETRAHVCEECNQHLGDEPLSVFFSHILAKSTHPELRHNLANFNILCLIHHYQYEFQDRTAMLIWPKIKESIAYLKEVSRKLLNPFDI